ncbi:MAG: hypothetical protein KGD59_13995 [Candidatus Heimdallarchaeota archaeon]|nr:hypothetical protein [Candidatus Heimdallarchaeota archaeon]MBY8995658.1 hypothetical protein [Candidatus Heimdallarchaeota archaeon]
MKLRILPVLLTLIAGAGIALFATTPIMTCQADYIEEGFDTDLTLTLNVYFDGSGKFVTKGDYLGSPEDDISYLTKADWNSFPISMTEEYPDIVIYLSFIGLGLAFLGMFLSIFGGNSGLRIAGALLGIIGGGLAIGGSFALWNWNIDFQAAGADIMDSYSIFYWTTEIITYSTFGAGWLASLTSSGLVILGSIAFLIFKPKK